MREIRKSVAVYAESTFKRNPGIATWASMLKYKKHMMETTGSETTSTNKRGELLSVINALKKVNEPCNVTIYTSSGYVYTGVNCYMAKWAENEWTRSKGRPLANAELWQNLYALCEKHNVTVMLLRNKTVNKYTSHLVELAKKTLLSAINSMKRALNFAIEH